jgi:glucose/arabinose dehydrogenase
MSASGRYTLHGDSDAGRALVLAFTPEGKDQRVYATGLRNCVGMAMQPGTGEL